MKQVMTEIADRLEVAMESADMQAGHNSAAYDVRIQINLMRDILKGLPAGTFGRFCVRCAGEIADPRGNTTFCSKECRKLDRSAWRKEKNKRVCKYCGHRPRKTKAATDAAAGATA